MKTLTFILTLSLLGFARYSGYDALDNSDIVNVEIRNMEGFHMIYYDFTGPYDKSFNDFGSLMQFARKNRIKLGKHAVGLYLDDPKQVPEEQLRSQVGHMIKKKATGNGNFKYKKVEACKAIYARYNSYEEIQKVYDAIGKYMVDNNLQPAGPSVEVYISKDGMKADVYLPIQ